MAPEAAAAVKRAFTPEPTGDVVLDRVQRKIADAFDELDRRAQGGSINGPAVSVAGDYQIKGESFVVFTGPTGKTLKLPKASQATGRCQAVYVLNTTANVVTVSAAGSDAIGTTTTKSIAAHSGAALVSDAATTWTLTGGGDPLTVSGEVIAGASLLPDRRLLDVGAGGTRIFAVRTGGGGVDVSEIEIENCLVSVGGVGIRMIFSNDGQIGFGTSGTVLVGNAAGAGLQIGSTPGEKSAFHGVLPTAQAAHPTTLADVITILTNKGFCA